MGDQEAGQMRRDGGRGGGGVGTQKNSKEDVVCATVRLFLTAQNK